MHAKNIGITLFGPPFFGRPYRSNVTKTGLDVALASKTFSIFCKFFDNFSSVKNGILVISCKFCFF